MLKDYKELGNDLKRYFTEIKNWEELEFNNEDKLRLSEIDGVIEVSDHSISIQIKSNRCIIPSQYILYAVFVKEFAIALRDHVDVFDEFKKGKSSEQIGELLASGEFDIDSLNLDVWSKTIALKPTLDKDYNFGAKSIVNGDRGKYKIRGSSDFFSSILLKIINVPDASSSILGKIIYNLSGNRDLYSYIEHRFIKKLPFLIKEKKSNYFAFKVISFLIQYDGLNKLKSFVLVNKADSFRSIKTDNYSLTSIFKVSRSVQSDTELKMGDKARFFSTPIYLDSDSHLYYFSTEWTHGKNSRLDIDTLRLILAVYYPEFAISHEEDFFIFRSGEASGRNLKYDDKPFRLTAFKNAISSSALLYSSAIITRFAASLITKPFVILTGLSGSGKTKLAQAFVKWICQDESQYCLVPVGADWTNREPLLGYPNALNPKEYVMPDSDVLQLLLRAESSLDLPFFIILDEMNLSHVERYFADFLSVMESDDKIPLHNGKVENKVPAKLAFPTNVFLIGTVNIDETTNMFSPKVLDRANTIEFRVTKDEISDFLEHNKGVNMDVLRTKGASMAQSFLNMARNKSFQNENGEQPHADLVRFFEELKKVGAEFGYRSASEILRLINQLNVLDDSLSEDEKIDIAIMQKLLPKLHGSRRKLIDVLQTLATLCLKEKIENIESDVFNSDDFDLEDPEKVRFPISLEKLKRMHRAAISNGFTSFAEA